MPENEDLTHFIFEEKHIKKDNKPSFEVFKPRPKHNNTTSVFRITGLDKKSIWGISETYVQPFTTKPLVGRADIKESAIYENDLKLVLEEPPPGHANITDWPSKPEDVKLKAQALALAATAYLKD